MKRAASAESAAVSYRSAGRAAITSGVIGFVAYGFMWAFLVTMISGGDEQACRPLITTHDVGVLLQSLFMIPLVLTFGGIVGQRSPRARQSIVVLGIPALGLTILSLLLIIANVLAGPFFMLWQGLLGIWLVVVNQLVSGIFSRGLRWFGTVVGVGLMIAAVFPVGNFLFVEPTFGPLPFNSEPPAGTERAFEILHNILTIGGFLGVAPLPIWTGLVGRKLLKMGRPVTVGVMSEGAV
jgi:hypothetical protein